MSKKLWITINLILILTLLSLFLSPDVIAKIVGSGTATPISAGASGVTSITEGQGILINPNPLITTGTISLRNATDLLIGGINVFNCTGNGHISGFFGNMTPFCSANNGNGTLTSVTCDEVGVTCNPTEITDAGMVLLKNASTTTIGGVMVSNCSNIQFIDGWSATNTPRCTNVGGGKGIRQITFFTPLTGNESPLFTNGTLMVLNATTSVDGIVRVANCSAGSFVDGWNAANTPRCTVGGSGTVTSIDCQEGTVCNPDPITSTGFIMGANATTSARGIVQVANCTGTDKVSGWSAGNIPICSADVGGSGTDTSGQNWTLKKWGTWNPVGMTATTFTAVNLLAPTVRGTATSSHNTYTQYIRYVDQANLLLYKTAGVLNIAFTDTRRQYAPLLNVKIHTNQTIGNQSIKVALSSVLLNTTEGLTSSAGHWAMVKFSSNISNTTWYCCTNAGATGTCTAMSGIGIAIDSPYNVTINMTNASSINCHVQNSTAVANQTIYSNIPALTTNLGIAVIANTRTSSSQAGQANLSIGDIYLEQR